MGAKSTVRDGYDRCKPTRYPLMRTPQLLPGNEANVDVLLWTVCQRELDLW
jgi:hypothetical protein